MSQKPMTQLKLMALDSDDLQIISSCCQDAVLKVGDLDYLATQKQFVLSLNRYAWELDGKSKTPERRKSVLHFAQVNGVKVSGIDRSDKEVILSLLAVLFHPSESPSGEIELVFAGDGAIKLNVECIEAQLSDMPAAWEAKGRPSHE